MFKFTKLFFSAMLISGGATTTAFAADSVGTMTAVAGDIIIERNGEYLRAENGSGLLAGDSIYAHPGSSAKALKGECAANLEGGFTLTVNQDGSCETVLIAQAAPAPSPQTPPPPVNVPPAPKDNTLLIVGGAIAAAGVVAVLASGGDDDTPASP